MSPNDSESATFIVDLIPYGLVMVFMLAIIVLGVIGVKRSKK